MIDLVRRLFDHARWADARVLRALEDAANPPARAVEIYAHLLAAEHVWLARLLGREPGLAVWPSLPLAECAALAEENAAGYRDLLAGATTADLERIVVYRNSAGQAFESVAADMLVQVATHGCYHRGQIAMLLRGEGAEPVPTDYIAFARGVPAPARTV